MREDEHGWKGKVMAKSLHVWFRLIYRMTTVDDWELGLFLSCLTTECEMKW